MEDLASSVRDFYINKFENVTVTIMINWCVSYFLNFSNKCVAFKMSGSSDKTLKNFPEPKVMSLNIQSTTAEHYTIYNSLLL